MKKNKHLVTFILLTLVFVIFLSGCTAKEDLAGMTTSKNEDKAVSVIVDEKVSKFAKFEITNIDVPFNPTRFETKVKPYTTDKQLSNVVNVEQFGEFSPGQLELLAKNKFVVNPSKEEQLFYIYEDNQYMEIPSFITTDSVLQVYHIFYDYYLRTLENEKLLGILEELTDGMLSSSIKFYNSIENAEVKKVQLKNIAFLGVAELVLEKTLPNDMPKEAKELSQKEFELIKAQSGYSESAIFPYQLDYSQYIPRGHYTRSDDLKRYFKAMMWYGQVPFSLYLEDEERNIEQTLQALLLAHSVYDDKALYDKWEDIYEATNFFVGSSDDLGIYEYGELLFKVYGEKPDLNSLNDSDKLDKLYKEADKLPQPRIQAEYTTVTTPVGKQFRFMGQRYLIDADIMQALIKPVTRPVSSGLDLMGVLGSKRAEEIQMEKEKIKAESGMETWKEYPKKFKEQVKKVSDIRQEEWQSNMYNGWMWTLNGYIEAFGDGYPSFMTNQAWVDKDLNTALASWSELKHDTILYGKQIAAEMGGGEEVLVKGYVEPNIQVYEKLLWLTNFSRENLKLRDLNIEAIDEKMVKFEELLGFLINCSVKELKNEELTEDEYYKIMFYGGTLEDLTSSFAGEGMRWFEITSDTDKNMAVIADFQTLAPDGQSGGGYVEAGVGPAYEIYTIVPIAGELCLARGAVFSYHEFISPDRLTDETWQEMIKEDKAPPMPEWTNSFIRGGKGEIPYPEYEY